MKINSLAFLLALLLLSVTCLGQLSNGGEAVDVIDGRTIVVATANRRVRVELQFIEVPEAGQQLHETVKDHLHKLLIGKVVEFKPRVIFPDRVLGRVLLNNVDVSQQMLRDGAAWHVPIKMSGQDQSGFDAYASAEAAARMEKRGVWSIVGLKSPAEFRAENEARLRQIEASKPSRRVMVGVSEFQTDNGTRPSPTRGKGTSSTREELDTWVTVFARAGTEAPGIKTYADPKGMFSSIYTSGSLIDFASAGDNQRLECRAIYVVVNLANGMRDSMYILGFHALSERQNFSQRRSSMTIVADKQTISIGYPIGLVGQASIGVSELMFYRISKTTLKRMANSGSVELRVNGLRGRVGAEAKALFGQLATSTD